MASDPSFASGIVQNAPAASSGLHAGAGMNGEAPQPQAAAAGSGLTLDGLQILVVEDEFLLAMEVEATLLSFGCSVVGPFAKLSKALDAARRSVLDAAVLDINLAGDMVYPLADLLSSRGVPFVFLTGYVSSDIPERFRAFLRLPKPLHPFTLRKTLQQLRCWPEQPRTT
jgi:CheY-like chemotaxis protein